MLWAKLSDKTLLVLYRTPVGRRDAFLKGARAMIDLRNELIKRGLL